MDEMQALAAQALRELLDNPERDDWDDLLAANRALIKAIETGEPMMRKNARIVAEYLREAGWRERSIGAATEQTGIHAGAD
jgi:Xaa-Pro aminopeptidase